MSNRVAIFIPSLRGGGAERMMVNLANEFSKREIDVDLVLCKAVGPYLDKVDAKVRVIDLGTSRVLRSLPRLLSYLRKRRPNAMLSALSHVNVVAVVANLLNGSATTIVLSERNHFSSSSKVSVMRSFILRQCMKRFYPLANSVVAVSSGVGDDLSRSIQLPRCRIKTIYNPVVDENLSLWAREPVVHRWFVPNAAPVVLAVGRLTKQKNFSMLIRAFAVVRQQRNVKLLILGDGEHRTALENLIRELNLEGDVELPGFKSNPFKYMKAARMLALSSSWEGLPGVLIQAMACGTPVVSTDCPSGPAEILEGGKWGRLVPPNDVDAFARAMMETLEEDDHPPVQLRAAQFSVTQAADDYLNELFR